MKKLILMMLVVMIPVLTMAQKKNKKATKKESTDTKTENGQHSFMIIKGVEISSIQEHTDQAEGDYLTNDVAQEILIKRHIKPMSSFAFSFDIGEDKSKEVQELIKASQRYRTMAQVVNHAAKYGWEFVSSTIVIDGIVTIHYYYMKR